jgi:mono/diheme cytochrome c family protein
MRLLSALIIASASYVIVACQSEAKVSHSPSAPAISPGAMVYQTACARCHGVALEGNPSKGTPPIDSVKMATYNDQALKIIIASGRGIMPAFPNLASVDVNALLTYLRITAPS